MTRRRISAGGGGRPRAAGARAAALVVAEVAGFLSMLVPIPLAWMWLGGKVYELTGSLSADLLVAFGGFFVTILLTAGALNRIDQAWVDLRRRAGYDQRQGALTQVIVVISTFALILFWIWFHILEEAFVIPFMPLN